MIKHFQYLDQIFKSAYQAHAEAPSADAWEKINAGLNKLDADRYKKKFRQWRRLALLLLLLMSGYVFMETVLIKGKRPVSGLAGTERQASPGAEDALRYAPNFPAIKNKSFANPEKDRYFKKNSFLKSHKWTMESKRRPALSGILENAGNPFFHPDLVINLEKHADSVIRDTRPPHSDLQKQVPFRKYWSITGSASVDQAGYRIDNDLPQSDVKKLIEGRESHNASFSMAILADYHFSRKWVIQTGVRYSNILIGIDPHEIYAIQQAAGGIASYKYITSSGYALILPDFQTTGDSLQTTSARHHLVFVSLPLMIKYRIGQGKWSLIPSLGMQINYLAKADVKTEIQDGSKTEGIHINQLQGKKTFYLSYLAEAGLSFQVNSRWAINAVPAFQYSVTSITRNNDVNTFPYTFGISLGVTHRF